TFRTFLALGIFRVDVTVFGYLSRSAAFTARGFAVARNIFHGFRSLRVIRHTVTVAFTATAITAVAGTTTATGLGATVPARFHNAHPGVGADHGTILADRTQTDRNELLQIMVIGIHFHLRTGRMAVHVGQR